MQSKVKSVMLIIALAMVILFAQGVSPAVAELPPEHTTDLAAIAVSFTQVDLTWTDKSDRETSYRVERAIGPGAFASLATLPADSGSYSDASALPNTTYRYRVFAVGGGGDSASSNIAEATTPKMLPPEHTTDLTATPNDPNIDLAWTDKSDREDGYIVQRSEGANPFSDIATLPADSNSYSDTSAVKGHLYSYRVYAFNLVGLSASSNVATAMLWAVPPEHTTDLVATAAGPSEINLTWTDKSDREEGYIVERAEGDDPFEEIAVLGANASSYSDTNVSSGNTYKYRVFAFIGVEKSASSNIAEATTP